MPIPDRREPGEFEIRRDRDAGSGSAGGDCCGVDPAWCAGRRQPLPEEHRGVAVNAALSAFERGCSLLVVDNRSITELEEELRVGSETRVRSWRLVPLVGG